MKKILSLFIVLIISILPIIVAEEGDCEDSFCDGSERNVERFKECVAYSFWSPEEHSCGLAHHSCQEKCELRQGTDSDAALRIEEQLKCQRNCRNAFDACAAAVPIPTCTGETAQPVETSKEGECKQITEDTARYNGKSYTPKCKDQAILIGYVCLDSKSEPAEQEIDCTTVEYGTEKYYSSCSQPTGMQGACSKDKPELTLEGLRKRLSQIRGDLDELYLLVIDYPYVVYMAWENRDALTDLKYPVPDWDQEIDIWIKLSYIERDINRMKENAYIHVKSGENLREYITRDKVMELWQIKLYNQLAKLVEEGKQDEIQSKEMQADMERLQKEYKKLERERYWKEEADFIDKTGYKIGYISSFQALREKGYSKIFDDPKTRFHEKIGEASGVLGYLPGTGDGIEIATLPSLLMDERVNIGMKVFHTVCAALPFVNAKAIGDVMGIVSPTVSFQTTDVDY